MVRLICEGNRIQFSEVISRHICYILNPYLICMYHFYFLKKSRAHLFSLKFSKIQVQPLCKHEKPKMFLSDE